MKQAIILVINPKIFNMNYKQECEFVTVSLGKKGGGVLSISAYSKSPGTVINLDLSSPWAHSVVISTISIP